MAITIWTEGGQVRCRLNTWIYIALTTSGSNARMYVDGALALNNTQPVARLVSRTSNLLGSTNWPDDAAIGGATNADYDEIKIFSRALTQSQIQADRNMKRSYIIQV